MRSFKEHIHRNTVKDSINYHTTHKIPLSECIFRPHSEGFYEFYKEAREQYNEGVLNVTNPLDLEFLQSDIGLWEEYEGCQVPLDIPLVEEEEAQELNKPKRGGKKKFYVYVKNDKGNVIKVSFGDTTGLTAKINDPEARKSFVARHQCSTKNDKTKPSYWSCRLPYYAKQLGLSGGGHFFW